MGPDETDWKLIRGKTTSWLREVEQRMHHGRDALGEDNCDLFAKYCLASAYEYFEAAFDAFEMNRPNAALACCRPIFENAITFTWCTYDRKQADERTIRWVKTSLSKERQYLDRLSKTSTFAGHGASLHAPLNSVDAQLNTPRMMAAKCLPDLLKMLEDIENSAKGLFVATDLYTMIFSALCAYAHGTFAPWRYFERTAAPGILSLSTHRESPPIASWIVLTLAVYVVSPIYRCFGWDCSKLKAEYGEALPRERAR